MDNPISTTKSAAGWQEWLRHPESDLGALEPAYRESTLHADVSQIKMVMYIYIAALLIYIVNDVQLFGLSPVLLVTLMVRVILVASALIMVHILQRFTSFESMDQVVFGAELVAICLHLYIIYSRPSSLAYIDLLLVLALYLLIPNRFHYRLIPALLFSLGDVILFILLRPDPGSTGVFALSTALVIGNLLGFTASTRLYTYRRNQFKAQHEERLARQQIEQLAAQLREANELLDQKVRERTVALDEANTALVQANRQLQELNDLKSGFLGVITHELRSPFVNIMLSLQLIAQHGLEHLLAEQRQQLQQLTAGVQAAKLMIDNLVKFATFLSKKGELTLLPVKLAPLVENALVPLMFQAQRKGLTLTIHIPDDLPLVRSDEERLGDAIYHLVDNAIKFTPSGGSISLRAWAEGDMVNLEVKDTGVGVSPDKLSSLWESFSQMADPLQRGVEGLGLGLALVKYVVNAHNGEVWAESQERVGSTFGFRVPANDATVSP